LDQLGHTAWARAECDLLCDPAQYQFNAETNYLRIRGSAGLPPRNQAVLRELSQWRDTVAREIDVPARSFLKDEILLDLARTPVKTTDKLNRVRGLPRPVEIQHGPAIIAVIEKGLSLPVTSLPELREYEPSPQQRFRADALWSVFQCLCAGRSIDPSLVTSRQEIGELFRIITAGEPLPPLRLLTGWRRQAVGDALLDLMAGKLKVDLSWTDTLQSWHMLAGDINPRSAAGNRGV
jgi:ribonuclease D